jgi:hypothetical protein
MRRLDRAFDRLASRGRRSDPDVVIDRLEARLAGEPTVVVVKGGVDMDEKEPRVTPRRGLLIAAAAMGVGLLIALPLIFLRGGEEITVATTTVPDVTTTVPATTSVPDVTTSVPGTTTALPPETTTTTIGPDAVLTWSRLVDTGGALSGGERETIVRSDGFETFAVRAGYVNQVIAGGPGLVAVGSANWCQGCWSNYYVQELIGWDHAGEWANRKGGAAWLSEDGETWTQVPESMFGPGVAMLTGVADNGSRLVAVGIMGGALANMTPHGTAAVWVSDDDGASWTRVPDDESVFGGEGQHLMWSVIATDSGFVAAGNDLWTSPDGWVWNRVGPMGQVRRIVRTDDGYVAVGLTSHSAAVWTSADAFSWARVDLPATPVMAGGEILWSAAIDAVAGPGGVIAVGQVQQLSSTTAPTVNDSDGAVWVAGEGGEWSRVQGESEVFLSARHQEIRGVALVGDRLVAVGTQRPSRFTTTDAHTPDVRFGPAVSWVSSDGGRTWIRVEAEALGTRGADVSMTAVATLGGKVVAFGNDGLDLAVWIGTWVEE